MGDESPFIQPDHWTSVLMFPSNCPEKYELPPPPRFFTLETTTFHAPTRFPSKTARVPYLQHSQEPMGVEESDRVSSSIEWLRREHVQAIRPGLRVAVAWPLFLRKQMQSFIVQSSLWSSKLLFYPWPWKHSKGRTSKLFSHYKSHGLGKLCLPCETTRSVTHLEVFKPFLSCWMFLLLQHPCILTKSANMSR